MCMRAYGCLYVYMQIYIHTHRYISIYIYTHICVYVQHMPACLPGGWAGATGSKYNQTGGKIQPYGEKTQLNHSCG